MSEIRTKLDQLRIKLLQQLLKTPMKSSQWQNPVDSVQKLQKSPYFAHSVTETQSSSAQPHSEKLGQSGLGGGASANFGL